MRYTVAKIFAAVIFVLSGLLFQPLSAARYNIDVSHSNVSFKVRHLVISKVHGRFDKFSGSFVYDDKKISKWSAEVSIDAASINTANADRDKHLRKSDFLGVEEFPNITFKSTKATDLEGNKAKLHGLLTIRGVEKPVVFDLEIGGVIKDLRGNQRAAFEATTTINRQDFGVRWNKVLETGGFVVGNEVEITIQVEGVVEKKKKKRGKKKSKKKK